MTVVRVEDARGGAVRRLVLDRPEVLNALNDEVRGALHDAIGRVAGDTGVRVVVLAGAGRAFSAGADRREARPAAAGDVLAQRWATGAWPRLLDDLERLPQATVARLQGHVIGGAALLAAACDLRVASDDVSISIPEVALGIPLTWAGLPRLVREIGLPRTREMVMTGRPIGAEEARSWGLVHRVASVAGLDAELDELVEGLLRQPPHALALTVDGTRALGRALSGRELAWADPDLLRWAVREHGFGPPPS